MIKRTLKVVSSGILFFFLLLKIITGIPSGNDFLAVVIIVNVTEDETSGIVPNNRTVRHCWKNLTNCGCPFNDLHYL